VDDSTSNRHVAPGKAFAFLDAYNRQHFESVKERAAHEKRKDIRAEADSAPEAARQPRV